MKPIYFSLACTLMATSLLATRESFDTHWKFAKFGKFNDCLATVEPGVAQPMIQASSTEAGRETAYLMDNDPETRWCAKNASPASVTIDLGRVVKLSSMGILWEKAVPYGYTVEGKVNGQWQTLVPSTKASATTNETETKLDAQVSQVRISIVPPNGSSWASIREVTLRDEQGQRVTPLKPATAEKTAEVVDFDDSAWRVLDVPHDWGIESPFLTSEPNETGKLPWNAIGWYRKTFTLSPKLKGKQLYLDFDGAMMTPKIYVNGQFAGEWAYGYASFRIDITPFVTFDKPNVVAVRLENKPLSTRWYPGAGLYRHVWIEALPPVHVAHWGVFAHADKIEGVSVKEGKYTATQATVTLETMVENTTKKPAEVQVTHQLKGSDVTVSAKVMVPAEGTINCVLAMPVANPTLWDITAPVCQTVSTTLACEGQAPETTETTFGIRQAEWKPTGFYLNGRRVQIKGVCQHHDMGPLGSAVHARALERQIEILKSFGTNTIRTSHNPPAPELLALCDKMGMLVDNEAFDIWEAQKYDKVNGYHKYWKAWHEKDIRNFVMRDRNHPSVIAWSAGNEITEQWNGNDRGGEVAEELVALIKQYDPTRATTVGCNHEPAKDMRLGKAFDVYGFNYKPWAFKKFAATYPNRPFVSSESSSCVSSRGKYYFPDAENFWKIGAGFFAAQVSSYDLYAPGWAYRPDIEFAALEDAPQCAGEFVWTGFDYIGEPTPYNQDNSNIGNIRNLPKEEQDKIMAEMAKLGKSPSRSSYFGIVDLCGFRKDRAYLYQAHWLPEVPMAHLLPHWNWVGQREGKVTPVFVYTSGDEAELFLNGTSLGRKQKGKGDKDRFRLCWEDVVYTPGELKVIAYKNGAVWAEDTVVTTGPAKTFTAEADRVQLVADGQDLSYITLRVVDAEGHVVPTADNRFHFTVTGAATLVGVCNGDATDGDSMKGDTIRAFSGMAQCIVRANRQAAGKAVLTITMDGDKTPQTIEIMTVKASK